MREPGIAPLLTMIIIKRCHRLHPNSCPSPRIDRDHITRLLDSALLTDQEFAQGEQAWQTYPDPLPAWGVTHSH